MKDKIIIIIKADTNDADYVESNNEITEEDLELIKPVIGAIKEFKPYKGKEFSPGHSMTFDNNYPIGELVRKDQDQKSANDMYGHLEGFDLFNDLTPSSEYGIHTIESIKILYVSSELILL